MCSGGERQLSMDGTSRVSREAQARFCEGLGAQFPGATRRGHDSVTVNLTGHEAGNGGHSQGTPTDCLVASSTRKPERASIEFGVRIARLAVSASYIGC